MEKIFLPFIVFIVFIIFNSCNKPQINFVPNFDNIGIKITYDSFEYIVNGLCNKVVHDKTLDTIDIINLVRIINMVHRRDINNSCIKLLNFYYTRKFEFIINLLDLHWYKGGVFISDKYNLYLGGDPHFNSQFCIIYD